MSPLSSQISSTLIFFVAQVPLSTWLEILFFFFNSKDFYEFHMHFPGFLLTWVTTRIT